ncbi:MAG TPA: DUF2279 domain-containing protein [Bacteroidia bacterium]|nr:DUF2279 domain-containing protein [Bacteroidia bacterium]
MYFRIYILISLILISNALFSNDSTRIIRSKKVAIISTSALLYSGSLVYLNQVWYKPYRTSDFHFFNDNDEWFGMDKCGHAFTVFYTNKFLCNIYQWAGIKNPELWSSVISFSYLLNIEIMDGFSSGWGFSWGDFAANTFGVSLFYIHHRLKERLFIPKFSFYPTQYPSLNPSLLGNNVSEQWLKDYNGQTYWLSVTPFYKWNEKLEWLCLSFGYGIDGCVGARSNQFFRNNTFFDYSYISRHQQFYLSIDIDLTKIKTQKKWLKNLLQSFAFIKIPAPALEWKGNNLYFRPLLFSN